MQINENALKPCPFCGCKDFLKVEPCQFPPDEEGDAWQWGYNVVCDASGFEGTPKGCGASSSWQEKPGDAVDAWNRRALTSATPPDVAGAMQRLGENLASFDAEVASELLSEGERADLWTEIDVNVDDLRAVLTALRLSAGGCKTERRKFYHHGYSTAELLKARKSPPEFFTDDGEAWRYEYTHSDGEGGAYDMLYRPASPTMEAGHAAT